MLVAARYTNQNVLIFVDNSDLPDLSQSISELKNAGFKEIPFKGIGPLNTDEWVTSVFLLDTKAL